MKSAAAVRRDQIIAARIPAVIDVQPGPEPYQALVLHSNGGSRVLGRDRSNLHQIIVHAGTGECHATYFDRSTEPLGRHRLEDVVRWELHRRFPHKFLFL